MNNLPDIYRENIIKKILNFFKRLLGKKDKEINVQHETINFTKENLDFKTNLQKEYNVIKAKEDIIEEVNKNPEILYSWSDERLKKFIDILDDKIIELDEEIEEIEYKTAQLNAEAE